MTLREWQDEHKGIDPVKRVKVRVPAHYKRRAGQVGWLVNVLPRSHSRTWTAWVGDEGYDLETGGHTFPVFLETAQSLLDWEVVVE